MYHFELFSRSFCRSLKLGVQLLYNFLRSNGCTVFRSSPRFIAKYKRHLVWHNQKNNVPWKPSRDINMTSFGVQNAKRGLHLFEDATLIFLSIYITRVCQSPIFIKFRRKSPQAVPAYLPKYRLSRPSKALPWRASSRAICSKNPDIVEKIHSSFHHLSNKSRTSFKKLRTILVHLRRLKWVLQTQQAYIKDLTVSGNTDSLFPSMGKNFHAENPPI